MTSSSTYPIIKGTLISTDNYTWNTADSLGRGASAIVYLGRHKNTGRVVAVKVFHDYITQKADDIRELELLQHLNHENIIKLIHIEKIQSTMKNVLIMEYCEGGSLHHMLDQPPYYYGLSEEEFLLVLSHVAKGIQYLRQINVIHRDIKPGNIMRYIMHNGQSVYKLTDFGAARNLNEDESFQSLYGTEEYLHPGIYEKAVLKLPTVQMFDAKVDLWSLGVTFFHTATGQLPFQPYGGRNNKQTMFEIITQKESGVISGIQNFEHGPIQWKRDLPETSPLSSGLKSIVIPMLAGLMEPDAAKMLTYDSLFRMVQNIEQKITVCVFYINRCENLKIYADRTTTLPGLQDQIASLTDIAARDQILLIGPKCLEEIIDPKSQLKDYPPHLLHDSIYLFQKEISENVRLAKPEIPPIPDFIIYSDMDADARLAHSCAARGELIKRYVEKTCAQQESLAGGLLCFRVYVESRLEATKVSQNFMKQLMDECKFHYETFFDLIEILRDVLAARHRGHPDIDHLEAILQDSVVRQVHAKARERIVEIEQYRDTLVKKLEDIKMHALKLVAVCVAENCYKKIQHHMSVILGVQSRFRRDKNVKTQMAQHDENIHGFERLKLQEHCTSMRSTLTDHCLPKLEMLHKNVSQIIDSLTKSLTRIQKIEKNINSVLNCQKLLSDKLVKLKTSTKSQLKVMEKDTGYFTGLAVQESSARPTGPLTESPELSVSGAERLPREEGIRESHLSAGFHEDIKLVSHQSLVLEKELHQLQRMLNENLSIIQSLDENSLQSRGSMSRNVSAIYQPDLDGNT